ncbi:MAG: circadian clock protein KaiB [Lentisphaerae bacterium]|jgi:circadian clock protein KaiB|nr:circadian clock protein KaiB [Lentisphaerota bacterium]MBT4819921.1 circadian clock protein KaiB [Lentisphaerota bacterium]MBT5607710.1 circadian clock protein KaiB [Lentisphaerota bacterium]MBT7059907.1 circadian clock protein KaiB [Lentisphaerota bacterium]MBT7848083.1 circadian clock protein KaiB [Lentisphaerota bacterium]
MDKTILKLFIVPGAARSSAALAAARELVDQGTANDRELVVVDVLQDPGAAEDENVLATPTLVKAAPLPERRAVGDLSDFRGLIGVLGL